MIELYSGTPGSGKSLHVARVMYYWLKSGKAVISNFKFRADLIKNRKFDHLPYYFCANADLTVDRLIDFSNKWFWGTEPVEDEILLVIDEAQILYNSRDWKNANRNQWLSFFTQHRKLGFHVILVSQFDEMLDKQIRAVIENEVVHRKLKNYGIKGFFLRIFLGGAGFVAVRIWYPMQEKLDSEFFRFSRKLAQLYDTYTRFDG